MDLRSFPAKVLAWTIHPNACGMKWPFAASHSSLVATPNGPNTGRPFFVSVQRSFARRAGMHQFTCRCQWATLSGTRLLRSSSDVPLDAVYIAPIRWNFPCASFLYRSDVGLAGSNPNWFRIAFHFFVKWYCG